MISEGATMRTLKFNELDATEKRLVSQLADESGALTPFVITSAKHVGELWESASFFRCYPRGSAQHNALASRLQLGNAINESITDVIKRIAPDYTMLEQRDDAEVDELILEFVKLARL
jgi:hypothetical protein